MVAASVVRIAVALACLGGHAGEAVVPSTPPSRLLALRVWHDATPGTLSLTVEAGSSGRDEANFIAVFKMWRVYGKPPRLTGTSVLDVGTENAPLCVDPGCEVSVNDGRFYYTLTAKTLTEETYYVVVRGVDPRITVSGAGWRSYADLTVQHFDATNSPGAARTHVGVGRAHERFAGTPASKPLRESVAYAALPCEEAGQGAADLVASGRTVEGLSCDGETTTGAFSIQRTPWRLSGAVEGVTSSYVRLLVVGRA